MDVMERGPWLDASQEAGRVIDVDDWAEIRRLHRAEGMGSKRSLVGWGWPAKGAGGAAI
jgi:hypothetical protein